MRTRSAMYLRQIDDELKEKIYAEALKEGVAAWRLIEDVMAAKLKVKIDHDEYFHAKIHGQPNGFNGRSGKAFQKRPRKKCTT